ncbi:type I-F CRISPR-associated protein Csy2 [Oceanobacter antarcticus]|uniref:Type I-F CRISPR-associated protein Csy2 n=1 Tax=Oceanobacter antarcticus TaxID=3133425 RepID=A0ABW8NFU9_9GAMM
MTAYLLLKNITVESANAITGITWGFPGPAHFLGFTHALSRKLQCRLGEHIQLGGVAIICHWHQVQAYRPGGYESTFALTRNPLTKEGNTAPFNEEGRLHMRVSLLLECRFYADQLEAFDSEEQASNQDDNIRHLQNLVMELAAGQRLAGGTITHIERVLWQETDNSAEGDKAMRRLMLRLLPGYVLMDRHDVLVGHHQSRLEQNPEAQLLDSLFDFVVIKHQAEPEETAIEPIPGESKTQWKRLKKPANGWLVPLAIGYQGISELYEPGQVKRSRDNTTPFRFVESTYSLGEWRSPHRIENMNDILWRYTHQNDLYLCRSGQLVAADESTTDSIFDC